MGETRHHQHENQTW